MANYTKEEIQAFADKDLRISKLALVKSLIEKLELEDVYETSKIIDLAEKYIEYVYSERNSTSKGGCVASVGNAEVRHTSLADAKHKPNWEQVAIGLNLAIPNSQNLKVLNQIADEYKKACKASVNPKTILVHIINTFGKYPRQESSVKTILESLKNS